MKYKILTSFATSTPVLFEVILLISSREFSQEEMKKQPEINAVLKKAVWKKEYFMT